MNRRSLLVSLGALSVGASAGCLGRLPGVGLSTEFERVEPEFEAREPPDVSVEGDIVVARGTIEYGSSSCGTIELAHAGVEAAQSRLDLLVVAADDSTFEAGCTDDLAVSGYRVSAEVPGTVRYVTATEHHAFGEAYSTTEDVSGR